MDDLKSKPYAWMIISQEGNIGIVAQDKIDLDLHDLQEAVGGGFIEIVAPRMFAFINPFLRLVVDDMGLYKEEYKPNSLASLFYGQVIVGDVVVCTVFNADPDAEPDIYAMEMSEALKLRERFLRLAAAVPELEVRNAALDDVE